MCTLKIGSFNTKDNKLHMKHGNDDAKAVAKLITKEHFDFLGIQELTINYLNQIKLGTSNYAFYGDYRYGNKLLLHMPYNENNCIATTKKVIVNETVHLPFVPKRPSEFWKSIINVSIMPRVATIVVANDENYGNICMINTHLDYQFESVQVRQLNVLKELILKYKQNYPIILTGDFNMTLDDTQFKNFVAVLRRNDIVRVPIDESTWSDKKGNEKTLDHVFISDTWRIEDAGVIDTNDLSDHNIPYVKVKK